MPDEPTEIAPPARGWHPHPQDPLGITRWFNGVTWTNQVTGGTPAQRLQAVVVAGRPGPRDQPGRGAASQPLPTAVLPSVASTVVITVLFGPFGIVPAAVNSALAAAAGRPTPKYWTAFGLVVLAIVLVAGIAVYLVP